MEVLLMIQQLYMCNEIIEVIEAISTKTVPTKGTSTKTIPTNFYILIAFLLIMIALLIAVRIYCKLIKY